MNTHKISFMDFKLQNNRNPALDIIRSLATILVIAGHFFIRVPSTENSTGLFDLPVNTLNLLLRPVFIVAVPFFILLSGYLMSNKEFSFNYLKKITRILGIWVICRLLTGLISSIFIDGYTLIEIFKDILIFPETYYSWYIRMYICLFFIIPFLNIFYHALNDTKKEQTFLNVMIVTTIVIPTIAQFFPIATQYFSNLYIMTYYFCGAYIKKRGINFKIKQLVLFLVLSIIFALCGSLIKGTIYVQDYIFLPTFITSITLFLLLLNIQKPPSFIIKITSSISNMSLEIYLMSCLVDMTVYPILIENWDLINQTPKYYIPSILITITLSVILGKVVNLLYKLTSRLFKKLSAKLPNKKEAMS